MKRDAKAVEPGSAWGGELLEDLPADTSATRGGAFAGWRRGQRLTHTVYAAFVLAIMGGVIGGVVYYKMRRAARMPATPVYTSPPPAQPARLSWTEGVARLGLTRRYVEAIDLPDRTLVLADDCDHAQVVVEVQDGETLRVQVKAGSVQELPRQAPLSRAATER